MCEAPPGCVHQRDRNQTTLTWAGDADGKQDGHRHRTRGTRQNHKVFINRSKHQRIKESEREDSVCLWIKWRRTSNRMFTGLFHLFILMFVFVSVCFWWISWFNFWVSSCSVIKPVQIQRKMIFFDFRFNNLIVLLINRLNVSSRDPLNFLSYSELKCFFPTELIITALIIISEDCSQKMLK